MSVNANSSFEKEVEDQTAQLAEQFGMKVYTDISNLVLSKER